VMDTKFLSKALKPVFCTLRTHSIGIGSSQAMMHSADAAGQRPTWRALAKDSETYGCANVGHGGLGAFLRPCPSLENAQPYLLIMAVVPASCHPIWQGLNWRGGSFSVA